MIALILLVTLIPYAVSAFITVQNDWGLISSLRLETIGFRGQEVRHDA